MDPVGLGAITQQSTTPAAQSLGSLDQQAFMNLMMAQLRYQDPLAPSDANAMMQQTSMLAQTELMSKLASQQQQLLGLQQATMATDLIGTEVTGVLADETEVTGVVEAIRFAAGGPVLVIGDVLLPLEMATEFRPTAAGAPAEVTDPVEAPLTSTGPGAGATDPVADPLTAPAPDTGTTDPAADAVPATGPGAGTTDPVADPVAEPVTEPVPAAP